MMRMQWSRLAWAAAAPLMLAGAVTLPAAGAAADTACSAWNGGQPASPGNLNTLAGIAVVSTCDVWAVGSHSQGGTDSATLAEHWTGTSWATVPSPSPGYAPLVPAPR
jgi:hypothetical protein